MFWGINVEKSIQINGSYIITNICGIGIVKVDNIIIATLNKECPQMQIDLRLNGIHTISCINGKVDICGYYANAKQQQIEELSKKAQNLQSEEEMLKLFQQELKNIKSAMKQK